MTQPVTNQKQCEVTKKWIEKFERQVSLSKKPEELAPEIDEAVREHYRIVVEALEGKLEELRQAVEEYEAREEAKL